MKVVYVIEFNESEQARPYVLRASELMVAYAAFLDLEARGGRVITNTDKRLSSVEGDSLYQETQA